MNLHVIKWETHPYMTFLLQRVLLLTKKLHQGNTNKEFTPGIYTIRMHTTDEKE
jgi:hypothetical protein